jgi:SAM-dependent methyltransferase
MNARAIAAHGSMFDTYAGTYPNVVNRAVELSGEKFEFFINLRISMMWARLEHYCPDFNAGSILDFGCGIGATEKYIRDYFPESLVYGYDTSTESIRQAQRLAVPRAEFMAGDGGPLPYPDGFFKLIYVNGTIHHIDPLERPRALAELKRVLAPGGAMFIFENNPLNPLMARAMRLNPFDEGVSAISVNEMEKLGYAAGFAVVNRWFYFFFPHFLRRLRRLEKKLEKLPLGAQYCVCFADQVDYAVLRRGFSQEIHTRRFHWDHHQ